MPFKALRRIALFVALVFGVPSAALAQCTGASAGDTSTYTNGWMDGVGGSFVRVYSQTRKGAGDTCNAAVQAEAWINPGGTPTVQNAPANAETYAISQGLFYRCVDRHA